ncbi:hypothetical protein QJS10_CPB04g01705 [Acorus calamus]|uniref:Histone-binding protein RBBP4-like N-terminal domain-containing protein n=1 Tax=Acorus calamus TaxID=4465 RepID=A0AAV9EZL9_ACOCL|nr:hypothetical protein QJS10_CPB04g01705 [Acorus calamus]
MANVVLLLLSLPPQHQVWRPGVDQLEEGEELQFDPSAYNYLRGFDIGWPCLSFDIVHDSLGLVRTEFPHTVYGVAGTQILANFLHYIITATLLLDLNSCRLSKLPGTTLEFLNFPKYVVKDVNYCQNSLLTMMMTKIWKVISVVMRKTMKVRVLHKVAHQGCVNRIRSMYQKPHICATWADTGHVQVWDFSAYLNKLAESETDVSRGATSIERHSPIIKYDGHNEEGYAIDWSPNKPGRLVSGDCKSCIHLWEPASGSWNVDKNPFLGHAASVEDLQWSPTEEDVFASCSVDGKIAIWDTRVGKSPALSVKAHDADVNVISWNRLASCMMASGSDDGSFSIRDLRFIKGDSLVAHFQYHKHPVTSIEWCPHEQSTLAVSSADNQLTIWDLSLERDEEEEAEFKAKLKEQATAPEDLPPQLLFVHQVLTLSRK